MRTLIWKEYRQNLRFLTGAVIIIMLPYLIAGIIGLAYSARVRIEAIAAGSYIAVALSILVSGFLAANMFAGERVDRSAEFVTYLPIPRRSAMLSKLIYALLVSLVLILFNLAVLFYMGNQCVPKIAIDMSVVATSTIMIFGVSWLLSSFMRAPTIPAITGIASVIGTVYIIHIVLYKVCGDIQSIKNIDDAQMLAALWFWWYYGLNLGIGLLSFIAGCICYLRRVEP